MFKEEEKKMTVRKLVSLTLILMLLLFAAACSKKAMENQTTVEPESQPEVAASEPAPEPAPVDSGPDHRTMFLDQLVYFEFDSAVLKPEAQSLLQDKAQWLKDNSDVVAVIIEGHCDERGTDAYNMALGAKRAESVKTYLVNLGVEVDRLQTQSFGEEKPLALGDNEEAWSQNRRAAFVIQ